VGKFGGSGSEEGVLRNLRVLGNEDGFIVEERGAAAEAGA